MYAGQNIEKFMGHFIEIKIYVGKTLYGENLHFFSGKKHEILLMVQLVKCLNINNT